MPLHNSNYPDFYADYIYALQLNRFIIINSNVLHLCATIHHLTKLTQSNRTYLPTKCSVVAQRRAPLGSDITY